jgi:hypothetical protein
VCPLVIDYGSGLAFISVRAVPAEIRTRTTCCCFHTPRSTPVQQIVLADELTASGAFDRIRAVHEQSSNSATNPSPIGITAMFSTCSSLPVSARRSDKREQIR